MEGPRKRTRVCPIGQTSWLKDGRKAGQYYLSFLIQKSGFGLELESKDLKETS